MIIFLRGLFVVVLLSMLAVTGWASLHTPLSRIPREVFTHPWFIATLFDAYWAFVAFYVWVAWKETSLASRVLWFVSIIALGNIAMSAYMLRELFRVSTNAPLAEVFTRRNPPSVVLPVIFAVSGVAIYFFA
jgi:hypothetical protein